MWLMKYMTATAARGRGTHLWLMKYMTATTARGREADANRTRYALSPINCSP